MQPTSLESSQDRKEISTPFEDGFGSGGWGRGLGPEEGL